MHIKVESSWTSVWDPNHELSTVFIKRNRYLKLYVFITDIHEKVLYILILDGQIIPTKTRTPCLTLSAWRNQYLPDHTDMHIEGKSYTHICVLLLYMTNESVVYIHSTKCKMFSFLLTGGGLVFRWQPIKANSVTTVARKMLPLVYNVLNKSRQETHKAKHY